MNRKSIGFIIAIVSAVIYGLVPLLTRTIYESGSNSLTVAFLRFVVCTLVFYIAHRLTLIWEARFMSPIPFAYHCHPFLSSIPPIVCVSLRTLPVFTSE